MKSESIIDSKVIEYCNNNDKNLIISSKKLFKYACCLGIDEAGRGPVLGPMVYAGAYIELRDLNKISDIGLDDSKKLKEETREELLYLLSDENKKICGYEVEIISPNFISNEMLNTTKTNLNIISQNAAINIIKRVIDKGVNLEEVYIDTVGSPAKYRDLILSHFPKLKVTVESKADATFKIVSAASIFAKVVRDKCIRQWQHRESVKFPTESCGSGYPSDPATKEFLKKIMNPIFGFPQFVRASWSTAALIMEKECVPVQWEDDEVIQASKLSKPNKRDSSGATVNSRCSNKSLLDFYTPSVPIEKRHYFFTSRKLERVTGFH